MKHKYVTISLAFIIIGSMVQLTACGSPKNKAKTTRGQTATVQRGNLSMDITAAGNLALSRTHDLPFDIFYTQGTVSEVFVQTGETIQKGQVLASLDNI